MEAGAVSMAVINGDCMVGGGLLFLLLFREKEEDVFLSMSTVAIFEG